MRPGAVRLDPLAAGVVPEAAVLDGDDHVGGRSAPAPAAPPLPASSPPLRVCAPGAPPAAAPLPPRTRRAPACPRSRRHRRSAPRGRWRAAAACPPRHRCRPVPGVPAPPPSPPRRRTAGARLARGRATAATDEQRANQDRGRRDRRTGTRGGHGTRFPRGALRIGSPRHARAPHPGGARACERASRAGSSGRGARVCQRHHDPAVRRGRHARDAELPPDGGRIRARRGGRRARAARARRGAGAARLRPGRIRPRAHQSLAQLHVRDRAAGGGGAAAGRGVRAPARLPRHGEPLGRGDRRDGGGARRPRRALPPGRDLERERHGEAVLRAPRPRPLLRHDRRLDRGGHRETRRPDLRARARSR